MRYRFIAATVAVLAAVLVAVPFAPAAAKPHHAAANVVKLAAVANGLRYSTTTLHAKAGVVLLQFTNLSQLQHNVRLEVGEKEYGGTKTIGHGSTTVALKLAKGVYHFYCSVPGHEDAGMSGHLIVS